MRRTIVVLALLAIPCILRVSCFAAAAGEECPPVGGLSFVCGPIAAEDLARVPGTHWIIGSGMVQQNGPGRLHLIDSAKRTWEVLYPGPNPLNELDSRSYALCPGPPDSKTFGAHGIAIHDDGNRKSTLLAVNHGREAVEVFKIDAAGAKPAIRWIGCVVMEKTVSLNSVAFLPGGGFVATKFYDPSSKDSMGALLAGKLTGGVLKWQQGIGTKPLAGTDLAGANGIEVSRDGKTIYVAAWGSQELVRFSDMDGSLKKTVVKVDFWPDNLRWAPDGTILVTGQNPAPGTSGTFAGFKGWTVARLDPKTMQVKEILKDHGESPLQNASVAIEVDGTLWIGPFSGTRVSLKPLK